MFDISPLCLSFLSYGENFNEIVKNGKTAPNEVV